MDKDIPTTEEQRFTSATPSGVLLDAVHMVRTVKVYGLLEDNVKSISLLNTLTLGFCSAGSFFLAIGISLVVSWIFEGTLTDTGKILLQAGGPTCGLLAVLCYVCAYLSFRDRRSSWKRIEDESHQVNK